MNDRLAELAEEAGRLAGRAGLPVAEAAAIAGRVFEAAGGPNPEAALELIVAELAAELHPQEAATPAVAAQELLAGDMGPTRADELARAATARRERTARRHHAERRAAALTPTDPTLAARARQVFAARTTTPGPRRGH